MDSLANTDARMQKYFLDSLSDGVFLVDANHIVTDVNISARHVLGMSSTQLVGQNFETIVELQANGAVATQDRSPITKALEKGGTYSSSSQPDIKLTMARADRSILAVSLTVIPLKNKDKSSSVVIFHDSSADEKIDRAKSEFIALVSHQLRTPVNIISWYVEKLLNERRGDLNDSQKNYLDEVQKSNKRVTDLVQAIVNVSRTDLNKLKHKHEAVDLVEVLSHVIEELKVTMESKGISLMTDVGNKSVRLEDSDHELVSVALRNILRNATQYTPDGGHIDVKLVSSDSAEETLKTYERTITSRGYLITIADSGIGVPDEEKDHIFTKLYRASNVQALDVTGVGLGLYIAQSFIQELGGQIWFDSELRRGATFYIFIPSEQ